MTEAMSEQCGGVQRFAVHLLGRIGLIGLD